MLSWGQGGVDRQGQASGAAGTGQGQALRQENRVYMRACRWLYLGMSVPSSDSQLPPPENGRIGLDEGGVLVWRFP